MRNKKDINLIWKHTHKDFRGYLGEDKSILYHDNRNGTVLAAIKNLPEDLYNQKLDHAKSKGAK